MLIPTTCVCRRRFSLLVLPIPSTVDNNLYKTGTVAVQARYPALSVAIQPSYTLFPLATKNASFDAVLNFVESLPSLSPSLQCVDTSDTRCASTIASVSFGTTAAEGRGGRVPVTVVAPTLTEEEDLLVFSFYFRVTDGSRTAQALVTLKTSSLPQPEIIVESPEVVVNPSEVAPLNVTVTEFSGEEFTVVWDATDVLSRSDATQVELFPDNPDLTGAPLLVVTESLFPGTYAFVATAVDALASSSADVTLRINEAPSGGSLVVVPEIGPPLNDPFVFAMVGWNDEDLPLLYSFVLLMAQRDGSVVRVPMRERRTDFSLQAYLGPGTFVIEGQVYDGLDAVTTVEGNVTAEFTFNITQPLDLESILQLLDAAIESQRPDELYYAIAALAAYRDALSEGSVDAPARRRMLQGSTAGATQTLTSALVSGVESGRGFLEQSANDLGNAWGILRASTLRPDTMTLTTLQAAHQQLQEILQVHEVTGEPLLPEYTSAAYSCVVQLMQANCEECKALTVSLKKSYFATILSRLNAVASKGLTARRSPQEFAGANGALRVSLAYAKSNNLKNLQLVTANAAMRLSPFVSATLSPAVDVSIAMMAWDAAAFDAFLGAGFFQSFWWSDTVALHSNVVLSLDVARRSDGTPVQLQSTAAQQSVWWQITDATVASGSACVGRSVAEGLATHRCVPDAVATSGSTHACVCRSFGDSYGFTAADPASLTIVSPSAVEEGSEASLELTAVNGGPRSDVAVMVSFPAGICVSPATYDVVYSYGSSTPCPVNYITIATSWSSKVFTFPAVSPTATHTMVFPAPDEAFALGNQVMDIEISLSSNDLRFDTKGLCAVYSIIDSTCTRHASYTTAAAVIRQLTLLDNDAVDFAISSPPVTPRSVSATETYVDLFMLEGEVLEVATAIGALPLAQVTAALNPISLLPTSFTASLSDALIPAITAGAATPSLIFTAVNDDAAQGSRSYSIAMPLTTADAAYASLPTYVLNVTVLDDDVAEIVYVPHTSTTLRDDDIGVLLFRFSSEPSDDVVVKAQGENVTVALYRGDGAIVMEEDLADSVDEAVASSSWRNATVIGFRSSGAAGPRAIDVEFTSNDADYNGFTFTFDFTYVPGEAIPPPLPSRDVNDGGLSGGTIALIIVGIGVLLLTAVIIPIIVVLRRRRKRSDSEIDFSGTLAL